MVTMRNYRVQKPYPESELFLGAQVSCPAFRQYPLFFSDCG